MAEEDRQAIVEVFNTMEEDQTKTTEEDPVSKVEVKEEPHDIPEPTVVTKNEKTETTEKVKDKRAKFKAKFNANENNGKENKSVMKENINNILNLSGLKIKENKCETTLKQKTSKEKPKEMTENVAPVETPFSSYKNRPTCRNPTKLNSPVKMSITAALFAVNALNILSTPNKNNLKTNFTCDLCHYKFTCKSSLKKHIQDNHSHGSILEPVGEYEADIAHAVKVSLTGGKQVKKHDISSKKGREKEEEKNTEEEEEESATDEEATTDPDWSSEAQEPKIKSETFGCNYCTGVYTSEMKLTKHQNRRHWNKKRFHKYKCKTCGESFRFRGNLRKHIKKTHFDDLINDDEKDQERMNVKKESIETEIEFALKTERELALKSKRAEKLDHVMKTVNDLKNEKQKYTTSKKKETENMEPPQTNSEDDPQNCLDCIKFKTFDSPKLRRHVKMHQKITSSSNVEVETVKLSSSTSDYVKVECKLCGRHLVKSRFREHTR